jgi:hypothetical protein
MTRQAELEGRLASAAQLEQLRQLWAAERRQILLEELEANQARRQRHWRTMQQEKRIQKLLVNLCGVLGSVLPFLRESCETAVVCYTFSFVLTSCLQSVDN